MLDERRRELPLDDHVAFGEGRVHVAPVDPPAADDVLPVRLDDLPFGNQVLDVGGVILQGLARVQEGLQDLPLDPDLLQGRLGGLGGLGGDRRHRLPDTPDLALGEDGLVGSKETKPVVGHVFGRDDGMDPVHGLGIGGVDGQDSGVGPGAPEDRGVEHPVHVQVVGVERRPTGLVQGVVAHERAADHPVAVETAFNGGAFFGMDD